MNIGSLPDQARGFDADCRITADAAAKFRAGGFSFALRYVGRTTVKSNDVSQTEVATLLSSGLAVMPVQHVANPGWTPSAVLGMVYGANAAKFARAAGFPSGINLWCDIEEVSPTSTTDDIIAYANEWHEAVEKGGYKPGLYVGDACGLGPATLFHHLRFQHYWSAYNLNRDQFPSVRGVQMRQRPYPAEADRVPGITFEYDENVISADAFGGSPILLLP